MKCLLILGVFVFSQFSYGLCFKPSRPYKSISNDEFSRSMYDNRIDRYHRQIEDYNSCKDREIQRKLDEVKDSLDSISRPSRLGGIKSLF